jgi:hypothetical protein
MRNVWGAPRLGYEARAAPYVGTGGNKGRLRETWHVKTNTGRHRKAPSLYRLAFEDAVSGLLSAKPADLSEKAARKAGAQPKKATTGSRPKG